MRLNELSDNPGATKARLRVGRGIGSGKGKTGGRGVKGQKSRSGVAIKGFEGGQMPIHMRLPKRGFNKPNRKRWTELSIATLSRAVEAGKLDLSKDVDAVALVQAGVIRRAHDGVRLIGGGEFSKAVKLIVAGATPGATKIVEGAKGSVTISDVKPERAKLTAEKAPKAKAKPAKKAAAPKAAAPKAAPKPKAEAAPKKETPAKKPQVLYTDGATDGEPDDLKKIKGIGPKFEGDLNAKGVYYFRQIAAWTAKDIKMIDEIIDSFPGRIERDEWVKQAAELAKG
jgi:large subunit ribosomal protein L15